MTLNLIYYKNILDLVLEDFFDCYGNLFSKQDDKYVLGLSMSKAKLKDVLKRLIEHKIDDVATELVGTNVLLVIGSCYPKDNMLLSLKDDHYFPKKLSVLIEKKRALKWVMAEPDIDIDIDLFNELCIDIFNDFFNRQESKRSSKAIKPKVVFVTHTNLDCYMMFKTIKWVYGNSNCKNVWKEMFINQRENFIALNDLISKYVRNKNRINRSLEFKRYALEVKEYLNSKLNISI